LQKYQPVVGLSSAALFRSQLLKKTFLTILKYVIPLLIIGWLLRSVDQEKVVRLWHEQQNWPMMLGGFLLAFAAVCLSFCRWYILVRGLGLPFRIADAFRLGFLGYLLTFISGGSVGGDLFKAVFIAHEQPGRRTEAVATVLIDRVVGLVSLLVITSLAIVIARPSYDSPVVAAICNLTLLATAIGLTAMFLVLVPRHTSELMLKIAIRVPKVGVTLGRLVVALQVYRRRPGVVAIVLALSLGVQGLLAISLFMAAQSALDDAPSLASHFIIVPLSMVAGALPFTPAGLGTFELAMDQLYLLIPDPPRPDGILVALAYRLITIVIAIIGVGYYWASRREVRELLDDAEHDPSLS
jgi:glycosyltransferase 2 family protein